MSDINPLEVSRKIDEYPVDPQEVERARRMISTQQALAKEGHKPISTWDLFLKVSENGNPELTRAFFGLLPSDVADSVKLNTLADAHRVRHFYYLALAARDKQNSKDPSFHLAKAAKDESEAIRLKIRGRARVA
jgi:hypothetical protein